MALNLDLLPPLISIPVQRRTKPLYASKQDAHFVGVSTRSPLLLHAALKVLFAPFMIRLPTLINGLTKLLALSPTPMLHFLQQQLCSRTAPLLLFVSLDPTRCASIPERHRTQQADAM